MLLNSAIAPFLSRLPTESLAALLVSVFISLIALPMLGTRTKQVFSYGRRNRRIINDRHDLFDVENTNKSNLSGGAGAGASNGHAILLPSTPPSRPRRGASKKLEITSPAPSTISSPRPSHNRRKKRSENNKAQSSLKRLHSPSSSRQPLSSHSVNISRHSSLSGPKKRAKISASRGIATSLLPQSPVVNVDIFVLDEHGRRVSQERRTSNTNIQVNQRTNLHSVSPTYQHSAAASLIVVSDNDDDDGDYTPSPQLSRRAKRWPRVMISSDEEDAPDSPIHPASSLTSPRADPNISNPAETLSSTDLLARSIPRHSSPLKPTKLPKSHFRVEIITSRTSGLSRSRPQEPPFNRHSPLQPPRSKPRQLTPIRRKGLAFPRLPSSPSTNTDLDISIDLADLMLSSAPSEDQAPPDQPPHLIPLLTECGQTAPVEFSAFIEAFPVHPIVRSSCSGKATFQKIGEASYSEVFGIGDVVLKIVPIRNEECQDKIDAETPAPSDAKDVLNEIVVTRALGEMCDGFVSLLKTYVVRGKYPSLLLDLWDEYNRTKGSESVRPDMLTVSQVYAIIVLPNGGPDLEAYAFSQPAKTGWRQACSLFWQITRALTTAENLVSFEHRDLHWGQILVKNIPLNSRMSRLASDVWLPMDHLAHGVKATVIDLGLARMDARADDGSTEIRWTPFDEETFEGEGDYQFDIYRLMRKHNAGSWADFRPLSNVMWLHYLLTKLLKSKNLRPSRKAAIATASTNFTERQCYESLLKMESLLAQSVREVQAHKPVPTKHSRRKVVPPTKADVVSTTTAPQCARDVLGFGEMMGWV